MDESGDIYVTGLSKDSWATPVRPFTYGYDGFAAKLDSNGGLTWNTFLGGEGSESIYQVAVDGSNGVYVVGNASRSWGSPVRLYTSGEDAYVARLNSSNGELIWNAFLGGSADDFGWDVTVDAGQIIAVGTSGSSWGSPVRPYTSGEDAFVARLDSSGGLIWNTFLGGSGLDRGRSVSVNESGAVYIAGYSDSSWGSPNRMFTSGEDAFAVRLNTSGELIWNTFLGGEGTDYGYAIAADGNGSVFLAGHSDATWGSPIRPYTAGWDAFAARLDSNGMLAWNMFLGGVAKDECRSLSMDSNGNLYGAGYSEASWGSPVRSFTGNLNSFVVKIPPYQFSLFLPILLR